ncbi:hypothetical protein L5515_019530 [Caenorhabditis briggsae]|uniref:Uncharacterized protein n=1 Tax=Caenorhabditis briggsae TaxID=6238 RepID=A0AAE9FIL2_CAEBR|nr:hypothetical protein L5515_019530 [Caenorhabditis briggsae]
MEYWQAAQGNFWTSRKMMCGTPLILQLTMLFSLPEHHNHNKARHFATMCRQKAGHWIINHNPLSNVLIQD